MRCETAEVLPDGRIVSPPAERNKELVAEVLMRLLPAQGEVLEVGSGTGRPERGSTLRRACSRARLDAQPARLV